MMKLENKDLETIDGGLMYGTLLDIDSESLDGDKEPVAFLCSAW